MNLSEVFISVLNETFIGVSVGQLIKIPLEWIRPEYLHQVPGIYRTSKDLNGEPKESESKNPISHKTVLPQKEKLQQISIISQR